jgi:hypothetical protein
MTLVSGGCPPPERDVTTDSRDVRGAQPDAAGPTTAAGGYGYVARRPHGAVGLVGSHFMGDDDAHRIVDRVADELETCTRSLEARGALTEGALQLVAVTGPRGTAEVTDVRLAPGGPVAAVGLQCIIAPLRASTFPSADGGLPAVAIDVTWGPSQR